MIAQGGQKTFESDRGFGLLIAFGHLVFLAALLNLGEPSLAQRTRVFSGTPLFNTVKTKLVIASVDRGGTIAFGYTNGA